MYPDTWPPTRQYVEDLERAAERLRLIEQRQTLGPFAAELGKSIATVLASTPYDKWPDFAKKIFAFVADHGYPNEARLYKSLLPKE